MNFIFVFDFILFTIIYLISFHLVVSGDDWFMVWLGLEVNMIMFIVLVFEKNDILRSEFCLKYYFIQRLGSAMFVGLFYFNKEYLDIVLCVVLRYKIGAGPFFFWFPSICGGISWISCFILIRVQKLIPLLLIGMFLSWIIFVFVLIGLIVRMLGALNSNDLKQLIAYSSIYHLRWILLCLIFDDIRWIRYLVMYIIIVFPVIFLLMWVNIKKLLEVLIIKNKFLFLILILSIAGIPPFLGFFIKWFAFINIVRLSVFFGVLLVFSSIIIFYVYFRVVYDVFLGYFSEIGWREFFVFKRGWFSLDFIRIFGVLFGLMIGLYFILCYNRIKSINFQG